MLFMFFRSCVGLSRNVRHNRSKTFTQPWLALIITAQYIQNYAIKCEQTTGPRRANFCKHTHIDKVRSSANFHQNPQRC